MSTSQCSFGKDIFPKESILWNGTVVMRGTQVERCVIGRDCNVKTSAAIFDGIIVNPQRAMTPNAG